MLLDGVSLRLQTEGVESKQNNTHVLLGKQFSCQWDRGARKRVHMRIRLEAKFLVVLRLLTQCIPDHPTRVVVVSSRRSIKHVPLNKHHH